MVPASVSGPPGAPHDDRRVSRLRRHARSCSVFLGIGAGLLTASASAEVPPPSEEITWTEAFLIGAISRANATTNDADVRLSAPVELNLVIAGERDGLPVYCTSGGSFRIRTRAIPSRLIVAPAEVGLEHAEIAWVELRPSPDASGWLRERLPKGANRWSLAVLDLPGEDRPQDERQYGTARFAAAVSVPNGGGGTPLTTSGWEKPVRLTNPDQRTGYRVTRFTGSTLDDAALAFARLPVIESALGAYRRGMVAIRPVDLALATYEHLYGGILPGTRDDPITGPAWSWLFETRREDARRRTLPATPVVAADARGIPWASGPSETEVGVFRGDVLVLDGETYALLHRDDGDGWLDEEDLVIHAVEGEVRRGPLGGVPGRTFTVLRGRSFADLRAHLSAAGYGDLGAGAGFGPDVLRGCREFQADQGLPATGIPDSDTLDALERFLERLRSFDEPGNSGGR